MRRLHPPNLVLVAHIPEEDGSVKPPTSKQHFVYRMPRHSCDLLLVSLEGTQLSHHADVVDLDETVLGGRQEPVPVLVPLHSVHCRLVDVKCGDSLAVLGVPQFHWLLVVFAPRGNHVLSRMPVHRLHISTVTSQNELLCTPNKVEGANSAIVRASCEFSVRW